MNTRDSILIYGANGYTGQLITEEAVEKGLNIHLAGRNNSAISALAKKYDVGYSIVDLEDSTALQALLKNFNTVIHCAGPFSETAKPMVEAAIFSRTNYLDITGEISVFQSVMSYHQEAEKAGIKLIPGVGFDVVPTDCLAAQLKSQLPSATKIVLSFTGDKTSMSRGTAVTMAKNISKGGFVRENGILKNVPLAYKTKVVSFPHREQSVMTIPWGDLMTTYHQTQIPNIEIFSGASAKLIKKVKRYRSLKFLLGVNWIQKIVRRKIENSVTGPSEDQLKNGKTYIVGKVSDENGNELGASLTTPEAYRLTALTAVSAAMRLKEKNTIRNGYLTPAEAFGMDFILSFEGVELIFDIKKPR